MPRDLILGTAGHIDHGKTSLVRALTGIDCDRLPEEKSRGITIDIGFAHLPLGDIRLGIVDVPGHEKFIKNMLAGATGFDIAMLVVAADDSIMPQTREHLEILSLLGIRHGVIALTKADLIDDSGRGVVELEIREFVAGSFLENAAIVPVSAKSGLGIDSLKQHLTELAINVSTQAMSDRFRMAIDRSFIVQGHGTVVTGTVYSGAIKVGDEVAWHLGDGKVESLRIRGLNQHGQSVEVVNRGQRAAINLANVAHEAIKRGQELASPGYLEASQVVTVRLHCLPAARHAIKHRLPCRLHIGTQETMVTVSILDADQVKPGQWAIAQFFAEDAVISVWGQPFVLRDSSAEHTIGGGQILQSNARKLRRRHIESLTRIEQLWSTDETVRANEAVWFAGVSGLDRGDLDRLAGIRGEFESASVIAWLPLNRLIHRERVEEVERQVVSVLTELHHEQPLLTNHDRGKVINRLEFLDNDSFVQSLIDRMLKTKVLVGDARRIALADFKPKLSINQRKLKDRIVADHVTAGLTPPEAGSYVNHAGGNAKSLGEIYEVAIAEGALVRIAADLFVATEVEMRLREQVRQALIERNALTVAEIRDLLGTTRKYAIPICEYLDKIGLTKRHGDQRYLATT